MSQNFIKSGFSERLVRANGLAGAGFRRWVFCPGMLFGASGKWWGGGGQRASLHEGLDLYAYNDVQNLIGVLGGKTKVPVIYGGSVVKIMPDFLGKTIITEHIPDQDEGGRIYVFYGHVKPVKGLYTGDTVREGDVIALLGKGRKSAVPPHLHVSIGCSTGPVPADILTWETIGSCDMLDLIDPLEVIGGDYIVLDDCAAIVKSVVNS